MDPNSEPTSLRWRQYCCTDSGVISGQIPRCIIHGNKISGRSTGMFLAGCCCLCCCAFDWETVNLQAFVQQSSSHLHPTPIKELVHVGLAPHHELWTKIKDDQLCLAIPTTKKNKQTFCRGTFDSGFLADSFRSISRFMFCGCLPPVPEVASDPHKPRRWPNPWDLSSCIGPFLSSWFFVQQLPHLRNIVQGFLRFLEWSVLT